MLASAAAEPRLDLSRAMAGQSGTAIVLDAVSGSLTACTNPEVAARRLAAPGSVIKPFTLLALLESGRITPGTEHVCERKLRIGGKRLDCVHPVPPGPL